MRRKTSIPKHRWTRIACLVLVFAVFTPEPVKPQVAISLVIKRTMKFGSYAAGESSTGTVIMPPTVDVPIVSGSLVDFGGTSRRARFQIIGEPQAYVIITLPSSITIEKGTSGKTMTVDNFTMNQTNPVKLSNQGKKTVNVGATLHVGTDQKKGNYNDQNSFTYDVDYL